MTSSVDIAAAIGSPLLRVINGEGRAEVRDVFLAEPHEADAGEPGDLVLGVGLGGGDEALGLVRRCADAGASGVVLRSAMATYAPVVAAAEQARISLIAADDGISWAHLVWLLRGVIDRPSASGSPEEREAGVHNDLFALADTVAVIVGAPVTFEDSDSRVLAYSSGQGDTDTARVATIVGRRVPEEIAAHFRGRGVFRRLASSDEPFLVPDGPDGTLPRLVVPVRAGGEWLGSIWAVVTGPVDDDTTDELRRAASVLALHLLRLRAQSDIARRSVTDVLRSALWQYRPERVIDELLPGGGPWRVVALRVPESHDPGEQLQIWEMVARKHGWARPVLADVDGIVFAVVGDGVAAGSWDWLHRLAQRLQADDGRRWLAVAGAPGAVPELPRSRAEARELLELIESGALDGPARTVEMSWDVLVVHRVVANVDIAMPGGPLSALLDHDARHGTAYVVTLRAWLRHLAEPQRAAKELQIHPNTLRYRMSRLRRVTEVDLDDPSQRLALQLQVEAVHRHRSDAAANVT